jgi:hypothetical protein
MLIDFFDIKGNYLTEIELSENDVKILVRYAVLDVIKRQEKNKKKKQYKTKEILDGIDKLVKK